VRHRFTANHPETFTAWVRNTVSGPAGVEGLSLGADAHSPQDLSVGPPSEIGGGHELLRVSGRTLGGRFTHAASPAIVIQQEVLISADEVMLEVAYALLADGHRLLGIAGEEFLLEVPERRVLEAEPAVKAAARAGAARLLRDLTPAVCLGACDYW
jgi:hypothetical protein